MPGRTRSRAVSPTRRRGESVVVTRVSAASPISQPVGTMVTTCVLQAHKGQIVLLVVKRALFILHRRTEREIAFSDFSLFCSGLVFVFQQITQEVSVSDYI